MIDREWKIARYWEQYDQHRPHLAADAECLGQNAALVRYARPLRSRPTTIFASTTRRARGPMMRSWPRRISTFEHGRYDDADYHYTLLRREYPRSELQFEAHLLGLQAKLRKYQGEDYDGTPLEEAKTLVKELNSQFADRLQPRGKAATRDGGSAAQQGNCHSRLPHGGLLTTRRRTSEPHAIYYAEVIKKYPDTDSAKKSSDRVAETQGRAGDSGQAARVPCRPAAGKPRADPRRANSRTAKRRHALGKRRKHRRESNGNCVAANDCEIVIGA